MIYLVYALGLILTIALLFYFNIKGRNESIELTDSDNITKICVGTLPDSQGALKNFEIIDSEDIKILVNYFESLHTDRNRGWSYLSKTCGMPYSLIFFSDNETNEVLFGGTSITVDGKRKKVSYQENLIFESLLGNIIVRNYQKNRVDNLIAGEIIKLSEEPGRGGCIIDSSDVEIDITDAYTFDTITNSGWCDLHPGDQVEVYLQDGTQKADAVFVMPDGKGK